MGEGGAGGERGRVKVVFGGMSGGGGERGRVKVVFGGG